jgi:hypothetical protein
MIPNGIHSSEDGPNLQLGKHIGLQNFPEIQGLPRYEIFLKTKRIKILLQ